MNFINAEQARNAHHVDGTGIIVAVLDSGCRGTHEAFQSNHGSRVLPGKNFTAVGQDTDVSDATGHGTAVSAAIAGRKDSGPIIAPGANILPLKITHDTPDADPSLVLKALSWLKDDADNFRADVVCLAFSDDGNYTVVPDLNAPGNLDKKKISDKIVELRAAGIPTVVAAGNLYSCSQPSAPGMGFPAIMPECISVGAVFHDHTIIDKIYDEYCNAKVFQSRAGRIAPFSQRFPETNGSCFTRLFAPGAPIVSAARSSDFAMAPRDGTSIAAPFVAGVIALLQEKYRKITQTPGNPQGNMPTCEQLERWLRTGAIQKFDLDEQLDSVKHTGESFNLVDALGALNKVP